ncbi:MAG TPA: TerB family tellurite resistance protein, partial [Candidatus Thermoplasmatota archaeon]|nr:TerB family tellurite resistance protein [Candidatus Thermoplasmatota archaeon]
MPVSRHLSRDEAFLLVGLLVADADGKRLPVEVDTLFDALERHSSRVEEPSRRLVQKLAAQVRERGLASLIGEVSRGLPRRADRSWAFGLAVEVAYADRELHPREMEHIADLGGALQLPDEDLLPLTKRPGFGPRAGAIARRPEGKA